MNKLPKGVPTRPGLDELVQMALGLLIIPCLGAGVPDPYKAIAFFTGFGLALTVGFGVWSWFERNGWFVFFDSNPIELPTQFYGDGSSYTFDPPGIIISRRSALQKLSKETVLYADITDVYFYRVKMRPSGFTLKTRRGEVVVQYSHTLAMGFPRDVLVKMSAILQQQAPQAHFEPLVLYAASGWIPRL